MKALRLHGPHDMRLHDEPQPKTGADQALLRITAVGICGSDLHWFSEAGIGDVTLDHPLIIGHEFAGIVEEGRLRGRRVAVDPQVPCDDCEFCREGNPNLCPTHIFAGLDADDGALRQFMSWPESAFHHLPDSLTDEDGAMLEPLGVAIHAVDLAHLRPGMTVGVIGCGPIGLLILQVARLAGATKIIATDKLSHRLDAARALGAAAVFQTGDDREEAGAILAETKQRGLDVLFEAAGENPAVETAIDTVKPGGRVILAGIPSDNRTSFDASTARRKGVTIMLVRRMKNTYPRATQLVVDGLVDVRSLVTHRFSMEHFEEAFAVALRREGLKVIITPSQAG
jgi:L-iditol 2-dehydrogenase